MLGNTAKGSRFSERLFVFFNLIVALAAVSLIYFTGKFRVFLFTSDALYLPVLFSDLLREHGVISDWYLTPAPYFFPDFPLFFLAYLFGSKIYLQILVFIVVQILTLFTAVWFLLSQVLKQYVLITTLLISILLLLFAVELIDGYRYLFASAYHYGAFIVELIFVALWLRYCHSDHLTKKRGNYSPTVHVISTSSKDRGKDLLTTPSMPVRRSLSSCAFWDDKQVVINQVTILIMSLMSFLVALSDNIFIVQTLIPFVGTIFLFPLVSTHLSMNKTCAGLTPVIAGILGVLSYHWIIHNPTRYQTSIDITMFWSNLKSLNIFFGQLITQSVLLDAFFIGYLILVILAIHRLIRYQIVDAAEYSLVWLLLFSFIGLISSILVFSFGDMPLRGRYMIAPLSWPVILLPLVTAYYLKDYIYYIGSVISFIVVILLVVSGIFISKDTGVEWQHYPRELACIDNILEREGVRNGIGQYWDAKYFKAFSRLNINIAQYFDNLEQHRWITSAKYYQDSYDFAIIQETPPSPYYKISTLSLIGVNGQPATIARCGSRILYIYGQNKMRVK